MSLLQMNPDIKDDLALTNSRSHFVLLIWIVCLFALLTKREINKGWSPGFASFRVLQKVQHDDGTIEEKNRFEHRHSIRMTRISDQILKELE